MAEKTERETGGTSQGSKSIIAQAVNLGTICPIPVKFQWNNAAYLKEQMSVGKQSHQELLFLSQDHPRGVTPGGYTLVEPVLAHGL